MIVSLTDRSVQKVLSTASDTRSDLPRDFQLCWHSRQVTFLGEMKHDVARNGQCLCRPASEQRDTFETTQLPVVKLFLFAYETVFCRLVNVDILQACWLLFC